jgi:hypothetical protein
VVLLATVSSSVFAGMPDSNRDISKIVGKLDGRKGIGQVIGDRDNPNVVYVRPTSKSFSGEFTQVGGSVSCHELHENRVATFRYPNEQELARVLAGSSAYSPAFESTFGVFARNTKYTNDIQKMRAQILSYTRDNREVYGRYTSTKEVYEGKKLRLEGLDLKTEILILN